MTIDNIKAPEIPKDKIGVIVLLRLGHIS